MAHEFGHWAGGLYHVFEDGGDFVKDTPDGNIDCLSEYKNVMNYGHFSGKDVSVTEGQLYRMYGFFSIFRKEFLIQEK